MRKMALVLSVIAGILFMAQNGYAFSSITNCLNCHTFPAGGGLHTKAGHATCTSCHVTAGDQSTTPGKCAACHPQGNAGKCNLVTSSSHSSQNCAQCHTECSTSSCPASKVLGAEDPGLVQLRAFRDTVLAKSALGRRIITSYYGNENAINAALEKSPALKAAAYKALQTFIPVLEKFM